MTFISVENYYLLKLKEGKKLCKNEQEDLENNKRGKKTNLESRNSKVSIEIQITLKRELMK